MEDQNGGSLRRGGIGRLGGGRTTASLECDPPQGQERLWVNLHSVERSTWYGTSCWQLPGGIEGSEAQLLQPCSPPDPLYKGNWKREGERGSKKERKRKERPVRKSQSLWVLPMSWAEIYSHTLSNLPWHSRKLIRPWNSGSQKERDIQKLGLGGRDSCTDSISPPFCQPVCWDVGRVAWEQSWIPKVSKGAENPCVLTSRDTPTSCQRPEETIHRRRNKGSIARVMLDNLTTDEKCKLRHHFLSIKLPSTEKKIIPIIGESLKKQSLL